mmetsp:Transcript_156532/g.300234  ORF Transcript_156532/g.300234 Transcript_156532/m.300234 type:complete len:361 (-) Transcript_156532:255-1337(-)
MRLRYYYLLILLLFIMVIMYNTTKMLDLLRTHSERQRLPQRPGPSAHINHNFHHGYVIEPGFSSTKTSSTTSTTTVTTTSTTTTTSTMAETVASALGMLQEPTRVVFSLTTTKSRIDKVKPTLDSIMQQTRLPDVVYLAVPPDVLELPQWLQEMLSSNSSKLKVLKMKKDYGPSSKLLATLREGSEHSPHTVIIYGDDDMLYGPRIVELHLEAQSQKLDSPTAFGTRRIAIGDEGFPNREQLLEATGSVSIRASALTDEKVFTVSETPDACRLSDDYWISHFLLAAGVKLELLPTCQFDFVSGKWPQSCSQPFESIPEVQHIGALSETKLEEDGHGHRYGGNWQDQLARYSQCQAIMHRG